MHLLAWKPLASHTRMSIPASTLSACSSLSLPLLSSSSCCWLSSVPTGKMHSLPWDSCASVPSSRPETWTRLQKTQARLEFSPAVYSTAAATRK